MKELIEQHFKQNYRSYLLLTAVLFLGLLLGTLLVNNLSAEQQGEISSYITTFINNSKKGNNTNYALLFEESLKQNIKTVIYTVVLGFSLCGAIPILGLIGYKGFSIGYSIASVIAILGTGRGLVFAVPLIIISDIVFLPTIFYISILSIKTFKALISGDYEDKRLTIIRFIIYLLIATGIVCISSLLKAYLSSNLFFMLVQYI